MRYKTFVREFRDKEYGFLAIQHTQADGEKCIWVKTMRYADQETAIRAGERYKKAESKKKGTIARECERDCKALDAKQTAHDAKDFETPLFTGGMPIALAAVYADVREAAAEAFK